MLKGLSTLSAIAACGIVLAGCVHSQVARTDERTAYVSASGSAFNSGLDVYKRVLLESAKATLAAGYDFFVIEQSVDTGRSGIVVLPGQSNTTASVTAYGNSAYGTAQTTYTPPQAIPIFKPGEEVRIHFLKASEVTQYTRGANDARWIIAHQ